MKKDWKYELARDGMAFGSILFYIIIMARSLIGEYMVFVYQLSIAIIILVISSFIIKMQIIISQGHLFWWSLQAYSTKTIFLQYLQL